jgi:hypothetical protein
VKTGKASCCVGALITPRRLEKDPIDIKYSTISHSTMSNGGETNNMGGNTAKRKRTACRQDNEMLSEPDRKLRRLQTADVNSSRRHVIKYFTTSDSTMSNSSEPNSMDGKIAKRKRCVPLQDNEDMLSEPERKLRRLKLRM